MFLSTRVCKKDLQEFLKSFLILKIFLSYIWAGREAGRQVQMCSGQESTKLVRQYECIPVPPERVWEALIAWWRVPAAEAQDFLEAVMQAPTLRASVFRDNVQRMTDQQTLTRFVQQTCSPTTVLRTVEDLVLEGHLSAYKAQCIAACICQRLDPSGQWRRR
jgi:hypothetical protein